MTDGQWLFAVMAALYLIESVRWLPVRARMLVGSGSSWILRRPFSQWLMMGRGAVPVSLLPPFQTHLVCMPWVLVPLEEELIVRDSALSSSISLRWDQVAPWVEGASVHVSRDVVLRWSNEAFARIWSERLRRWRDATPEARAEDFSQFAKESLNTEKAATEVQHLSRHLRTLRWMASLIFVWCFGVITVLYTVLGEGVPVLIVAAMLIPLLWTQSLLYWRTTKVPELRGRYRFWQSIAIAFLPQMAMRAADYAMKDQLFCPHPLATRTLIGEVRWTQLCRETWKAIQYTGKSDRPSKLEHALLSEFFAQQKVEEKDLEECPARQPGSEAYCPSCLSQFTSKDVLCKDCGGVAVKTWS